MNAGAWTIVGVDRFEDMHDPFYRIGGEYTTEKKAERAAKNYVEDQRKNRFRGGEDQIFIVSPSGEKRRFKT